MPPRGPQFKLGALARPFVWGAVLLCGSCSRPVVPDPKDAAQAYADAAERGDANAIYGMMTRSSQQAYGREGTQRLVRESREELRRQGKALQSEGLEVDARAEVRFIDGETATLQLEQERFRVSAAGTLPVGARTPTEALDELRQALARRSYAALARVLSAETRTALENDLTSLVDGLESPETLDVHVEGDTAEVTIPGGHFVRLKREDGVWRVQDFE